MSGNKSVTAVFIRQYTITIQAVPEGSGSVTLNPPGGIYDAGTSVQLTPEPAAGYCFNYWGGDIGGSTKPKTITMNRNWSVTANFLLMRPSVAAGQAHSVALRNDGTVWAWGRNNYGQLGDNSMTNRSSPVRVVVSTNPTVYLTGVKAIAAGFEHTLALKSDGTVWAWGKNQNHGALGDGTTTNRFVPVQVVISTSPLVYLTDVKAIAAGYDHTLALKNDGTVWAWGYNGSGCLGDGTALDSHMDSFLPVQVVDSTDHLTGVVAIAMREAHSVALKADGTVWAWGGNGSGQLGAGAILIPNAERSSPGQVVGPEGTPGQLTDVTAIAAGDNHTMAVKADGTMWVWGNNDQGQVGDGNVTCTGCDDPSRPVQVADSSGLPAHLTDVMTIAGGDSHTLAVKLGRHRLGMGQERQRSAGERDLCGREMERVWAPPSRCRSSSQRTPRRLSHRRCSRCRRGPTLPGPERRRDRVGMGRKRLWSGGKWREWITICGKWPQ